MECEFSALLIFALTSVGVRSSQHKGVWQLCC